MITRKEYMQNSSELFDQYYLQFATPLTRHQVLASIGIDRLLASEDKYLNDVKIPFNHLSLGGGWWWATVDINTSLLKEAGEVNSRTTRTCVGKTVARLLIEEHKAGIK